MGGGVGVMGGLGVVFGSLRVAVSGILGHGVVHFGMTGVGTTKGRTAGGC